MVDAQSSREALERGFNMIYEYKCKSCVNVWEEVLPMSEMETPTKNRCPHCNAVEGSVYRYFSTSPSIKMDANMDISKPHNQGGFQDAMQRLVDSPGVKGTPEEAKLRAKHLS